MSFLTLILYSSQVPEQYNLQVGLPAPKDVLASRDVIDRAKTQALREQKAASVPLVYDYNPNAEAEMERQVAEALTLVKKLRDDASLTPEQRADNLSRQLGLALPPAVLQSLLSLDNGTLDFLRNQAQSIIFRVMEAGVEKSTLEKVRAEVDNQTTLLPIPKEQQLFISALIKGNLRPNRVLNEVETANRRKEAMDSVEPVRIVRGQLIVGRNQTVTAEHIQILKDLGLDKTGLNLQVAVGSGLIAALMVFLAAIFLRLFRREVYEDEARVVLIGLVVIVTILLTETLKTFSGYLAPVASATMLLTTLVEPKLAMLGAFLLATIVGFLNGGDMRFLLVALTGGLIGVYGLARVHQRADFMRAGFLVSLGNVVGIIGISLAGMNLSPETSLWEDSLWGILNGLLSAIITIGSLPFLESLFGIMTPVRLLEYSNPAHPLLRKLLVEAPGTYHHSIIVANLAEAAAEAVGADPLLARVGSYYHDIGKTRRPYFFIDNQFGMENPHDRLSPRLSTLVITSHIKDGLELGEKYHLPEAILRFVREHHGTSLVSYFYARARENQGGIVQEEDFRYGGPKPQSRESAIVMLADSVEAAVRSLDHPSTAAIETMVKKILREKLEDGQLDQVDLTLRQIDVIGGVFVRSLTGIFHPRIDYPDTLLKEMEGRREDAGNRKQLSG
ncbi:MAG: HDIG domain-containing protein [Firmicutes bacterium]|nr:HDIG domain-containing protein [Bacillota bacterium]